MGEEAKSPDGLQNQERTKQNTKTRMNGPSPGEVTSNDAVRIQRVCEPGAHKGQPPRAPPCPASPFWR